MSSGAISTILWGVAAFVGIVGVVLVVLGVVSGAAEGVQRDR